MNKKSYYILLTLLLFVFVFLVVQPAGAQTEITYPRLPGAANAPVVGANTGLMDYVQYIITLLIISAGLVGVFIIVLNGARILLAAGSPQAISSARENIFGSVLGIALLISAFIILNTINPDLVDEVRPSGRDPDLWYVRDFEQYKEWAYGPDGILLNDPTTAADESADNFSDNTLDAWLEDDWTRAPLAEADLTRDVVGCWDPGSGDFLTGAAADAACSGLEDTEYDWRRAGLVHWCDEPSPDKVVLVWTYSEKNFLIDPPIIGGVGQVTYNLKTHRLPCFGAVSLGNGGSTSILQHKNETLKIFSFQSQWEVPGVYVYFYGSGCNGLSSLPLRRHSRVVPYGTVKRGINFNPVDIKILNGASIKERYGVVLTTNNPVDQNKIGECTAPYIPEPRPGFSSCQRLNSNPYSQAPFFTQDFNLERSSSAFILNVWPVEKSFPRELSVNLRSGYLYKTLEPKVDGSQKITAPYYASPYPIENNQSFNVSQYLYYNGKEYRQAKPFYHCREGRTCLKEIIFNKESFYVFIYTREVLGELVSGQIPGVPGAPPIAVQNQVWRNRTCALFTQSEYNLPQHPIMTNTQSHAGRSAGQTDTESNRDIYRLIIIPSSLNLKE